MGDAVGGILFRAGHVLLGLRSPDEDSYPGCWDLIGGHIEGLEDREAALSREMMEEIGILPLSARWLGTIPRSHAAGGFPSNLHVFAVSQWRGEPRIVAPEHAALRWFSIDDACALPNLALPAYVPFLRSL